MPFFTTTSVSVNDHRQWRRLSKLADEIRESLLAGEASGPKWRVCSDAPESKDKIVPLRMELGFDTAFDDAVIKRTGVEMFQDFANRKVTMKAEPGVTLKAEPGVTPATAPDNLTIYFCGMQIVEDDLNGKSHVHMAVFYFVQ